MTVQWLGTAAHLGQVQQQLPPPTAPFFDPRTLPTTLTPAVQYIQNFINSVLVPQGLEPIRTDGVVDFATCARIGEYQQSDRSDLSIDSLLSTFESQIAQLCEALRQPGAVQPPLPAPPPSPSPASASGGGGGGGLAIAALVGVALVGAYFLARSA